MSHKFHWKATGRGCVFQNFCLHWMKKFQLVNSMDRQLGMTVLSEISVTQKLNPIFSLYCNSPCLPQQSISATKSGQIKYWVKLTRPRLPLLMFLMLRGHWSLSGLYIHPWGLFERNCKIWSCLCILTHRLLKHPSGNCGSLPEIGLFWKPKI